MPDPTTLPPNLKLGIQLQPGEPTIDLFSLIDVPHRHDKDGWLAFVGTAIDFAGLALLAEAEKLAKADGHLPRWRLKSDVGEDHFQAKLLGFAQGQVVVSLRGFRWAHDIFQRPTPIGSTFQERARNGRRADLTRPEFRRSLDE